MIVCLLFFVLHFSTIIILAPKYYNYGLIKLISNNNNKNNILLILYTKI